LFSRYTSGKIDDNLTC